GLYLRAALGGGRPPAPGSPGMGPAGAARLRSRLRRLSLAGATLPHPCALRPALAEALPAPRCTGSGKEGVGGRPRQAQPGRAAHSPTPPAPPDRPPGTARRTREGSRVALAGDLAARPGA